MRVSPWLVGWLIAVVSCQGKPVDSTADADTDAGDLDDVIAGCPGCGSYGTMYMSLGGWT